MRKAVVLYADDNMDDALLVRRALTRISENLRLETVVSSKEAIEYLDGGGKFAERRRYPLPDLVLLDFRLPPGGGLEVVRWVRRHPDLNRLVVIFFTGSVLQRDVDQAYESGANALIEKELTFEGLQESLERLVLFWMDCNQMPSIAAQIA